MLCLHWTGHYHPSLTSMSCALRCSPDPTIEPTMRQRAAEEPSRLHRQDTLLSRWDRRTCRNPLYLSHLSRWFLILFKWNDVAGQHMMMMCPSLQLCGYTERKPLSLQVFVGTADDRSIRPHPFYQIHRWEIQPGPQRAISFWPLTCFLTVA